MGGDIASPDTAEIKKIQGLKNKKMNKREVSTIQAERMTQSGSKDPVPRIFDSPKIEIRIFGKPYNCLLDTGATTNVCSEGLFLNLKSSGKKMVAIPTCGLFCSTAIGRKKQRIKLQSMIPVEIDGEVEEMLFMVIPNLSSELIIGCESFVQWRAQVNFDRNVLIMKWENRIKEVPFLNEDGTNERNDHREDQVGDILEEAFFVETLDVEGQLVARIQVLPDKDSNQVLCCNPGGCEECSELLSVVGIREVTTEEPLIHEYIRMCRIDTSATKSLQEILWEKLKDPHILNRGQKEKLIAILLDNAPVFSEKLGKCNSYIHSFEVTDITPFNHKCRTIPSALAEKTNEAITRMLEDGVISKANSQYINPLCLVLKKDGSVRLTIDARTLNKRCVPNHYRTEAIEQLLARVNGAKFFSTIDLSSSFWQIELDEGCRDYTAFLHNGKQYRFNRAPFGHNSSSAALLRALDNIFGDEISSFAASFVDDICIFDVDFDEHLRHIDFVLSKLKTHGLTVKPSKVHLFRREVEFLGFIVSQEGIRPNPSRIAAINDIPPPKNVRQLRRFLGVCQYQARFLINYAQEVQPLRDLIKKETRWRWTNLERTAFERVKALFAESIQLQKPDYEKPFIIYTDGSYQGIGGILVQEDENDGFRVIATTSRSLSKQELRLFPTEVEICAVYHAIQKFRNYIFNRRIIVRSDSISLSFMHQCKLTSSRISRYIHEIMSHDITVEYIRGTTNIFADLLSRIPRNKSNMSVDARERNEVVVMKLDNSPDLNLAAKFKLIKDLQREDAVLREIIDKAPELGHEGDSKYALHGGILYKLDGREEPAWKTYVPASIEIDIIKSIHDGLGHSGTDRVMLMVKEHLYIKHVGNKVRKVVSQCLLCQKAKPKNVVYDSELQVILRESPRDLLAVDTHGPMPTSQFGYRYLFVVHDVFSKFTKLYPMKSISTKGCREKIIKDFIKNYGMPKAILSDNATIFASRRWREPLEALGVKVYHCSKYNPASNPSERALRDVTIYLRVLCHRNHKSWFKVIPVVENIMNRSINSITRFTPHELMLGERPPPLFKGIPPGISLPSRDHVDAAKVAVERQRKRAEKRKLKAKRRKRRWDPVIGDKVLVKDHKLSSLLKGRYHRMELLYKGPMEITKVLGCHTYELKNLKSGRTEGRFHKQMMRPYLIPLSLR